MVFFFARKVVQSVQLTPVSNGLSKARWQRVLEVVFNVGLVEVVEKAQLLEIVTTYYKVLICALLCDKVKQLLSGWQLRSGSRLRKSR